VGGASCAGISAATASCATDGASSPLETLPLRYALNLLKKIPDAEKGWPAAQRVRWFRTFAMNVSQIYDGEAMDPVELKIEIDLENDPSLNAK
jgi:hypothetical protein